MSRWDKENLRGMFNVEMSSIPVADVNTGVKECRYVRGLAHNTFYKIKTMNVADPGQMYNDFSFSINLY
jgi:hypothetical protein